METDSCQIKQGGTAATVTPVSDPLNYSNSNVSFENATPDDQENRVHTDDTAHEAPNHRAISSALIRQTASDHVEDHGTDKPNEHGHDLDKQNEIDKTDESTNDHTDTLQYPVKLDLLSQNVENTELSIKPENSENMESQPTEKQEIQSSQLKVQGSVSEVKEPVVIVKNTNLNPDTQLNDKSNEAKIPQNSQPFKQTFEGSVEPQNYLVEHMESTSTENDVSTFTNKEHQVATTTDYDAVNQTQNDQLVKDSAMLTSNKVMDRVSETNQEKSTFEEGDGISGEKQSACPPDSTIKHQPGQHSESAMKSHMNMLLLGKCKLQQLPALPKKVVRIFISSTFTDTREERNAMMEHVYPKLADYCKEKHGLEFQIVDMRWGVPDQAQDNHSTTDLCLQEIEKCQEVSVGPNFVAIIGDKYGYRPIPNTIEATLFNILSKEASTSDESAINWELVKEWYKEDTNVVPPQFVLQAISSKITDYHSEFEERRNEARNKWSEINSKLTQTLRAATTLAFEKGLITEEQKQQFFMSVTENEITSGVLHNSAHAPSTTFCIMRKIQDVEQYLSEPKAPKFADVTPTHQLDTDAKMYLEKLKNEKLPTVLPQSNLAKLCIDWSSSGANISIENMENVDIAKYAQQMMKDREMHVFKHKEYLDDICSRFFKNISRMIQQGSAKERQTHDDLTTEVLQHMHLAKDRCYVFEGREDVLEKSEKYLSSDMPHPFIIHGSSGCGKTSVVAKIIDQILNSNTQNQESVMIARFLGTSTNSCNLHQLLVSLCQQLSFIYEQPWQEPDELQHLVESFHSLLRCGKDNQLLVLVLDSIDQMLPTYNAYKLQWLPTKIPVNVKIIVSTIGEDYPILANFKHKYKLGDDQCIEIKPLGEVLGMKVIRKWLEISKRTCAPHQEKVIKLALGRCSLPLYARIAFDYIMKWRSFDNPSLDDLEASVQGAINKLFASMEQKFGNVIVKHCLAYLTASRNGLSESELENVLSMDDALLNTVFQFWKPPVRRIPSLIWTRIRSEVNNYIVQRSSDDIIVLYWYHRQFIHVTKKRYLTEQAFSVHVHTHLAEFFSGKWSAGKKKPFMYTEAQMKRFGLETAHAAADRKLPTQPYWTEMIIHGSSSLRYNKRKMSELPFHLVKSKKYDELRNAVFFNYEWLFNKIRGFSVQQLLEEFEVFMQSDKLLGKDKELKLLYVNLQMMRPDLIRYPNSLSYELQGTLSKYVGKYENITNLVKQCDAIGIIQCPIVPLYSCFNNAEIGFAQNINFRRKDPQQMGGACTCARDFGSLYLVDYDKEGKPVLLTYDMLSGEKVRQVAIKKVRPQIDMNSVDIYCQIELVCSGEKLVGFYKVKDEGIYKAELRKGSGFVDVIDISTGQVENSFECFMYRDEFLTPLVYATNNHMCVINGWKMPLINIRDSSTQSFNRATYLNEDETFLVLCSKDKTIIREHESKEMVGDCDLPESQIAVTASHDFTVIAMMGSETRNIYIFDLSNKQMKTKKRYFQMFKPKHVFKLDARTNSLIETVFKPVTHVNEKGRTEDVTNNRVFMKISPDRRHLLVVFIGWKWTAFMWCLNIGRYSAKFVGNITGIMEASNKLPQFNYDGSCVVYNADNRRVVVVSTDNGQIVNEYTMQEDVKDIRTSSIGNKMAVMLQKNVAILNIDEKEETKPNKTKKVMDGSTQVLLEREMSWHSAHKEVVCRQEEDQLEVEEVDDVVEAVDTDRIASARSKRQYAIARFMSPDGNKVMHFHSRVQVIDTKSDEVKYTPRKNDTLLRVHVEKGVSSNKIIPIPGLQDASRMVELELCQGDRIVNENNKVKFRVDKEPNGQFKIMTVPSVLTVYTTEDLKLRRSHRIDAYKESVLCVANNYIITSKRTQFGHFVNVYELRQAKLLATHKCTTVIDRAAINNDETIACIIDRSLTLRVMNAPTFTSIAQQFTLHTTKHLSSAFIVKGLLVLPNNPGRILIQYGPEGSGALIQSRYIMVDIVSGSQSTEMMITPSFQDITMDGELGIDSTLNMYDLPNGAIIRKIPYNRQKDSSKPDTMSTDVSKKYFKYESDFSSSIFARISGDKKFVVFADKQDRSLHLVTLDRHSAKLVVSCNSHAASAIWDKSLSLRNFGRVIVLRTDDALMCFAIINDKPRELRYTDEKSRAVSLVQSTASESLAVKGKSNDANQVKSTKSVFERKAIVLTQMGHKAPTTTQGGKSTKPTCLLLGESFILSNALDEHFTQKIDTWKVTCQSSDEAMNKLDEAQYYISGSRFDVIVFQIISSEVVHHGVDVSVSKVKEVVNKAEKYADYVVFSEATLRLENRDFNDKIMQVNAKLNTEFKRTSTNASNIVVCENSNLNIDSNPNPKYFQDGINLSKAGFVRLTMNLKRVLAPLFKLHHI